MGANSAKNITSVLTNISQQIVESATKENSEDNNITLQNVQSLMIEVGEGGTFSCGGNFDSNQVSSQSGTIVQRMSVQAIDSLTGTNLSKIENIIKQAAATGLAGVGDSSENQNKIVNDIKESINLNDLVKNALNAVGAEGTKQNVVIKIDRDANFFVGKNCSFVQQNTQQLQVYQFMSAVLKSQFKAGNTATALAKVSQTATAGTLSGGCSGVGDLGSLFSILFGAVAVGIIVTIIIFIIKYGLGGAVSGHSKVQVVIPSSTSPQAMSKSK